MAHFSVHVGTVQRGKGENAIACAAYISRSKLDFYATDKATNITVALTWDYSKKGGLSYSKIYAPEHAASWVYEREKLWNKAEQAENRWNSNTAGKVMIALPKELSDEQNIALADDIASWFVEKGMIVDVNLHNDRDGNPHMHLQHTGRELVEDRYGNTEFAHVKNREWRGPSYTKSIREFVAERINKHYELAGLSERVSHKSYKELGIDLIPTKHEGPARNIKNSELVELNRQIANLNAEKIKEKPSIILDVLGMNNPVFTKEQIATELEKRLHAGIDFEKITNIEELQSELSRTFIKLYNQIINSPEITCVNESDLKGRALYTTTKRIQLEERFTANIEAMHKVQDHVLGITDKDLDHLSFTEKVSKSVREVKTDAIEYINAKTGLNITKPKKPIVLSKEQREAVIGVVNGSNISVLEGIPGAGKTTTMRQIVRLYQKSGYKVIGVAPSSSASLQLSKATGIECKNATLWRKEWLEAENKEFELVLRGDYYKEDRYQGKSKLRSLLTPESITKKHVIIIDEASMGELANMDYFVSKARNAGAKMLFVADNNQLSAVGFGGACAKTTSIVGSIRLEESRRQSDPDHQKATKLLSQYRVREALDIYHAAQNIIVTETESEANSVLVKNFTRSYIELSNSLKRDDLVSTSTKAIGVFANKTRDLLNDQVRTQLKEAGVLKGNEYRLLVGSARENGKYEKKYLNLQRGEQIVFTRNNKYLGTDGVCNGEFATILKLHKPNKECLGTMDLLVHKANGKKEKVRFDLNELATNKYSSKYFHDGIAIDYGYAVTSHKVQGATIDDFAVKIEKGVGFEVFNVLSTRHKNDVQFVVSKDVLFDAFYESLDTDAPSAKNRFDINSANDTEILKTGLVKMLSKRANTSFASDYRTMGQTKEDKIIKNYLDKSEETVQIIRKITSWQQLEMRQTGQKPAMWDNRELWAKFIESRLNRAIAARTIEIGYAPNGELAKIARVQNEYKYLSPEEFKTECKIASYKKFKDRLIQLNMNYATIEKHASQIDKKNEIDKIIVHQKSTTLHQQEGFKNLVNSISLGNARQAQRDYMDVKLNIAESKASIDDKLQTIQDLEEDRQGYANFISREKDYREVTTPEYLRRIYNEDTRLIVSKYQELVKIHGGERAVFLVEKQPSLLGSLKGVGIGRLISFGGDRKDAIELCKNLGRQLRGFNESGNMINTYNEQMKEGNFGHKIFVLREEIEHLRSLLPADIDNEFLGRVGDLLNLKDNKVSWKEIQSSKLFEAVKIGQIEKEYKGRATLSKAAQIERSDKITKLASAKKAKQSVETESSAEIIASSPIAKSATTLTTTSITKLNNEAREETTHQIIENDASKRSNALSLDIAPNKELEAIEKTIDKAVTKSAENVAAKVTAKTNTQEAKTLVKQNYSQEKELQRKASLDFRDVRSAVTSSIAGDIFEKYAKHINTDGKITKKSGSISCGSLNMNLTGSKLGLWNRFSSGEKGDIFSFVEKATGCSKYESLEMVASIAGISPSVKEVAGTQYKENETRASLLERLDKESSHKKRDSWEALSKVPLDAPKFEASKHLGFLRAVGSKVTNTHEYRNKHNELLGVTVRVVDRNTGKKQVLPIAYCYNEAKDKSRWNMKGFEDNGTKPIYKLEELSKHQEKPILIVEGEKTTDAATKLFKDHAVLSWMGGAQSVDRVDWSKLAGREITIWPDNDKPGIEAAKKIANFIDSHNGFSGLVKIIDTEKLNLPEKWDLADRLPESLKGKNLEQVLTDYRVDHGKVGRGLGREKNSQVSQVNITQGRTETQDHLLSSINMLIASCRLDKDHYLSKSAYNATLINIAQASQIDFEKITDPSVYRASIESLQDQYKSLKQTTEYELLPKASSSQPSSFYEQNNRSKENQLANECTIEIAMLHKAQLGNVKLTDTHIHQIKETALAEISKLKRFTDADKEGAAENIYKAIASDKWRCSLNEANALKTEKAKSNTAAFGNILNILATLDEQKKNTKSLDDLLPIFEKQKDLIEKVSELNLSSMQQSLIKTFPKTDTLNALIKDSTFLAKYNQGSKDDLFNELKNSDDLNKTASSIHNKCENIAQIRVGYSISIINTRDHTNKNQEFVFNMLVEKKQEHQDAMPYLKEREKIEQLKHYSYRLEAHEIVQNHYTIDPGQAKEFQNEMICLDRFSKHNIEDVLKICKTETIESATKFAQKINMKNVISKLENQSNSLNLKGQHEGGEYVQAIAQDAQIMKYVDEAIASGERFDDLRSKDIKLTDYSAERNKQESTETVTNKHKDITKDFER